MINPINILIVRTDRIGDVVLSLPMAGIIKKHYPGCKVTFLVKDYTSELVTNHPHIDDVIILKEVGNKIPINENISILKKKKFDVSVIVYPTFKIGLIIFLSGIKTRIGIGYRWYSFLFNKKVFEHRKKAEKHELEYNVSLLSKIGINELPEFENVSFDLVVEEEIVDTVKNNLMDTWIDLDKPIIIVHPGSGGSAVDLPEEKMSMIVHELSVDENINLLISGAENEYKLCESISSGTGAVNLAGQLDLPEMIALISLSEIFISNSTGPIHIAAALGKSIIGFYPKIAACSKERWGPYTRNKVVYLPEIECSDCTKEQCEKLNCMNSIDINKVTNEVKNQIKLIT